MYKFFNQLNEDIIYIRTKVFIEEQGFEKEFDIIDDESIHILYYNNDSIAGTARLYKDNKRSDEYYIGRVAVLKEHRKYGIGMKMIKALEDKGREIRAIKFKLSAQKAVENFYKKNGYIPIGDIYYDENCPHIMMEKIFEYTK